MKTFILDTEERNIEDFAILYSETETEMIFIAIIETYKCTHFAAMLNEHNECEDKAFYACRLDSCLVRDNIIKGLPKITIK